MICGMGKREYLRFSALRRFQIEANTHGRNENVDNLFAFPTKAFVEKTTKQWRSLQKRFCATAHKSFGYLHDVIFAQSRWSLLRTHTTICARSSNNFRQTQPTICARCKKVLCSLQILIFEFGKNDFVQKSLRRARIPVAYYASKVLDL